MSKNHSVFRRAAAAAAAAVLLTLSACGEPAVPTQEEGAVQAIEVHTTTPARGTIDRQTEFVGRVEAAESIKVYATSSAKVLETYVSPGQYVEKGTLLFELDTEYLEIAAETARLQYESTVSGTNTTIIQTKSAYDSAGSMYSTLKNNRDSIEAAYDRANAAYSQAKAAVKAAKEQGLDVISAKYQLLLNSREAQNVLLEAAKADENATEEEITQLEDELKRIDEQIENSTVEADIYTKYTKLVDGLDAAEIAFNQANNAFTQNYDALDEQVGSALKSLVNARNTYKNTKGDEDEGIVGTVQSQIELAKINYDNALKSLREAKVYAPVSGVISMKNVAVSDMAAPGMPAYVIDQDGAAPMVSFNLSEDGANALSVGSQVTVIYNNQEFPAQITELSNTANPQTGLYAAKAQTDAPMGTSRSGGVVKVKASTAKAEGALLLSLDLVEYDGNQPFVYVYRDGTAVRVDIVTGISSAEDVVVLSGLTEEDQIITTWHPDLRDGAAVALVGQ